VGDAEARGRPTEEQEIESEELRLGREPLLPEVAEPASPMTRNLTNAQDVPLAVLDDVAAQIIHGEEAELHRSRKAADDLVAHGVDLLEPVSE
jgi:hypothetical protein